MCSTLPSGNLPIFKTWSSSFAFSNITKIQHVMHTLSPDFFRGGGVSDQNENLVGRKWKIGRKILRAPPVRKKRGSQIFRLRRAFFVVEVLKTVRKPLIFRNFFQKPSNFWKKGPQNFSPAPGFFSKKSSVDFTKVLGQSRGVKNILPPPPLWRGMIGNFFFGISL